MFEEKGAWLGTHGSHLTGLVDHRGEIWILFPSENLGKDKGILEKRNSINVGSILNEIE